MMYENLLILCDRTIQPLGKLETDEGPVSTECAPYLAASLHGIHLQSAKS